ncbi:CHAT domain-containing protein [Crucibulum laeve]|uniref:CHAT domain-containing protein n=1 Tax=Crucibulum laeve TaxID=68775 RepID=A0A5C3LZL9_9AGAR|nr:CHAT domain-containing protein [Crucibulum laeve]
MLTREVEVEPDVIERLKNILQSVDTNNSVIAPGEFTESEDFVDTLRPEAANIILKFAGTYPHSELPELYSCLSEREVQLVSSRNTETRVSAIKNAIGLGAAAIKFMSSDYPKRGVVINVFARAVRARYRFTQDDADLDKMIYYFRKAVETEAEDEEFRPYHIDDLGKALWERFVKTSSVDDFEESRDRFKAAAAFTHHDKPLFTSHLGKVMNDRAVLLGNRDESLLDECLQIHFEAVTLVDDKFHGSIDALYQNLAETYCERYIVSTDDPISSLDENVVNRIIELDRLSTFISELAGIYNSRFSRLGHQEDADRGVKLLESIRTKNSSDPSVLAKLGEVTQKRAISIDSQVVLTQAVDLFEAAVSATAEDDPHITTRLQQHSLALFARFEMKGAIEDVKKSISLLWKALESAVTRPEQQSNFFRCLSGQLLSCYEVTENKDDLDTAVVCIESALEMAGSDIDRALCLRGHGKILFQKYAVDRVITNIDDAVRAYEEAIEILKKSGNASVDISWCYNDLGNALNRKFVITGSPDEACKSISSFEEAISRNEINPTPNYRRDKTMYLIGLGNAHLIQYERWNQTGSLDAAISCYKDAVDATDDSDSMLATRTGSLCWALQLKYDITNDRKFLDSSENYLTAALDRPTPFSGRQIAFLHNRAGSGYLRLFLESDSKDTTYLDKASGSFRVAMNASPLDSDHGSPPTTNFIRTLMFKCDNSMSSTDMIAVAVQLLPLLNIMKDRKFGSEDSRFIFLSIGDLLLRIYMADKAAPMAKQIGDVALKCFGFVYNQIETQATFRIHAGLRAAILYYELYGGNTTPPAQTLVGVTALLPEAILLGPSRLEQLRLVKQFSPVPSRTLAYTLSAGQSAAVALLWFERGRCIIWDRVINQKTDIDDLKQSHEDLAVRYETLRDKLSQNTVSHTVLAERSSFMVQNFQNWALEYNQTVDLIRQKEGFKNFLLLSDNILDLQNYATEGPIVVVNVTTHRSDAVIIASSGVTSLSLPLFTENAYLSNAAVLLAIRAGSYDDDDASSRFEEVLKWLWDAVACPILDQMGYTERASNRDTPPRIWWMTSACMNYLPIHAAGDHKRALATGEPCSVMDRVICSYIPTLKALDFVRQAAVRLQNSTDVAFSAPALLVQMPTTPNKSALQNAEREVSAVADTLEIKMSVNILTCPKRRDVLVAMRDSRMVHFVCHGLANQEDPSLSQLQLQDWRSSPLDVRTLMRASMPKCEFVYLSACDTALNKVASLREEALHLSSAFHMAGIPYTIGTLWNIDDSIAADIATLFYSNLADISRAETQTGDRLEFKYSAQALHTSIMEVREQGTESFLWAAYAHYGA